jgi:hypothetical protein
MAAQSLALVSRRDPVGQASNPSPLSALAEAVPPLWYAALAASALLPLHCGGQDGDLPHVQPHVQQDVESRGQLWDGEAMTEEKPDNPDVCVYCDGPILVGDTARGAGDGYGQKFAHDKCWRERNPEPLQVVAEMARRWGGRVEELTDPVPETCEEALRLWDSGMAVFSVEMGGLGPSYEQAIQIVAFEMVRYLLDKTMPAPDDEEGSDVLREELDAVARTVSPTVGGLSGAMADAAINLACVTKRLGWRVAVRKAGSDRMIQVMKFFPEGER